MAKGESTKMGQEITHAIRCELPGFEQVTVTFDLMATQQQVNNFVRHMGADGTQTGVVAAVEGWPSDEFGPDPWDIKRVPGVFHAWVSKKGWALAMKAYLDDPN
jgi:hypothetical protein